MKPYGRGGYGNGEPRQNRRIRRELRVVLAGLLLAGLVALASAAAAPQWTDAAWEDSESAEGAFKAIIVPTPVGGTSPQCRAANVVLLGSQLTIQWRVPGGASGYTIEYSKEVKGLLDPITGPLLSSIKTTGDPSNYKTVVSGGLLSNTLGGSVIFGIRLVGPGGWASSWLTTQANFPALIGVNDCTFYTVPSP